ncbi:hypothetical protein SAMN04487910_2706 [Aquimarina amphilecti]|uniref:PH domain-containing protein n=1 Tax=Aquimarina amphilecti TaxID=1038014 RepID=A0A1H7QXI2_AQUAM|nr:hypothetical protein [Aquimarina amphilecti]SEL52017.1 hypothetical protein SAMN04487910_2706 [Aquimarina amphilecti]
MNRALNFHRSLIIFGIPLLIIGVMILITKSPIFIINQKSLSIGITFDLLLTVPFVYFLLIRKTKVPKISIISFLIIGMVVCYVIIPPKNQYYLNLFKTWIFPVLELSILSYVIYNLTKAIKRYKSNRNKSVDFFTALKNTCLEILPKGAVNPVVMEIAVLYYGFIYWKKRKLNENEFSYHKNSGTISLLTAIICIIAIETVVFHILLSKWNTPTAWILTFLSIYSGIQIFGFIKSMFKRPISIENNKLFLRYGIMNETIINLTDIDSIEVSSKDIELDKVTRKLSFLGELESHNIVIRLKEENTLIGLYGIKRTYKNLVLHIDNKIEFKNQIMYALENRT